MFRSNDLSDGSFEQVQFSLTADILLFIVSFTSSWSMFTRCDFLTSIRSKWNIYLDKGIIWSVFLKRTNTPTNLWMAQGLFFCHIINSMYKRVCSWGWSLLCNEIWVLFLRKLVYHTLEQRNPSYVHCWNRKKKKVQINKFVSAMVTESDWERTDK